MNTVLLICREEWRYWLRSRLSGTAFAIMALVLVSATVYTWTHIGFETQRRAGLQAQAEEAFLNQPARHPHRMVHYGHYAFRAPVPLAALDPGIDPYAGMVIFLEGHRQNSAMFAEAGELASLSRFGSLSPAFALQVLAPLLLLILGFSTVSRERERGTLVLLQASGVGGRVLLAGKALALFSVVALLLVPFALAGLVLAFGGAGFLALGAMLGLYGLYLGAWAVGITAVSAFTRSAAATLALLLLAWVVLAIAVPRFAATAARVLEPIPGQLESELTMLTSESELSDGHTVDPGADPLVAQLLDLHGVDDVAELPVNIRGLVSAQAEAATTAKMNEYAEQRLSAEQHQARRLDNFALLSPLLAIRRASMALAGTDLEHQHRFLREAEQLRFDFVQALNELHANELSYSDDIRRSSDPLSEQRTRVDASSWQLLNDFRFAADPVAERMARATPMALMLGVWLLAALALAWLALRRLER